MIELNSMNIVGTKVPKVGDTLIIQTKKSKDKKILVQVKDVTNGNEVILSNRNSFYNHGMYYTGESWVWRVWNLGDIQLTSSTNNMVNLIDF